MSIPVFSNTGTKKESISLPKEWQEVNMPLLAQAVRVFTNNEHPTRGKTKTRSELTRTTKKVYKQKGTGGARHGSKNAPIYVGGAIAHGPRGIRRLMDLPKSMRMAARMSAFLYKAQEKSLVAVEKLGEMTKAKEGSALLSKVRSELALPRAKSLVLVSELNDVVRALRNVEGVTVKAFKDVNAKDLLTNRLVFVDASVLETKKVEKTKKEEKKVVAKKETTKKSK